MADGLNEAANTSVQLYNIEATKDTNTEAMNFAMDEAWKQREFNLAMWNRQNAYNTPLEQMKRFEAAGLNKNLIYGQGTPGNASSFPSYDQPKWNPKAPTFDHKFEGDLMNKLLTYQDIRMRDVQIANQDRIGKNLDLDNISKGIENTIKGNEAKYSLQDIRGRLNLQYQKGRESQTKQGLMREQTGLAASQADVVDADLQIRQVEKLNKDIMTRILSNQQAYERWKQDYIKQNKYNPENSPTFWRELKDLKNAIMPGGFNQIPDTTNTGRVGKKYWEENE